MLFQLRRILQSKKSALVQRRAGFRRPERIFCSVFLKRIKIFLDRKQFDQHHSRYKSSHVGPESYAAGASGGTEEGSRPAQKFSQKPVSQHQPSRKPEDKEYPPGKNTRSRVKNEVGPHHASDRAAGPYGWQWRGEIE